MSDLYFVLLSFFRVIKLFLFFSLLGIFVGRLGTFAEVPPHVYAGE